MRLIALAAAVLSLSACATVQARHDDGKTYTCIPNSANDRGPFVSTPPGGERLTVKGDAAEVKVAETK